MVGSVALGAARVPGVVVVPPAVDLSAAVRTCVRSVAHALVRAGVAALRTAGPAAAALLATVRVRPVGPLTAAQAGAHRPSAGPRLVAQAPAVPAQRGGEHTVEQVVEQAAPVRSHEVALPGDPTAPRRARALLQAAALEWDLDDDTYQDAAMVVTELVANAVDHACTPSTLSVGLDERGLCVAVRDGRKDRAPRPRPVDPAAPRGRGLQMVDALTVSWGVTVHADGKTVWAVLRPA